MENLIKALQIFLKYQNNSFPTHCEHDTLYITGITNEEVSFEDKVTLKLIGFYWSDDASCFISTKYGSA